MILMKKIFKLYKLIRIIYKSFESLADVPNIRRKELKKLLSKYESNALGLKNSIALDIGCGLQPQNPFNAATSFGIDIQENVGRNVKYADLTLEPIPFGENTFDYITAYNFLEHVPQLVFCPDRRFAFVELMNEIWRTLKPNGIFFSETPIFPYSSVFRDPTHVNILTEETFPLYFDDVNRVAAMYGFKGSFKVLHQFINEPFLIVVLQKCPNIQTKT
jgi:SAM-dependent methyltransferase